MYLISQKILKQLLKDSLTLIIQQKIFVVVNVLAIQKVQDHINLIKKSI